MQLEEAASSNQRDPAKSTIFKKTSGKESLLSTLSDSVQASAALTRTSFLQLVAEQETSLLLTRLSTILLSKINGTYLSTSQMNFMEVICLGLIKLEITRF